MIFSKYQHAQADEKLRTQESFESFRKSPMWDIVCAIHEAGDFLDIVIRNEKDPEYKCLCGVCWVKDHFTPEQLTCIRAKQRQLEPKTSVWDTLSQLFPRAYDWGIISDSRHMDGRIVASSPEEAERKLREYHLDRNSTITVFY